MKTLKSLNFGFRGWMLLVYQFMAYVAMAAFTNFPMNMLGDMYGGAQKLSTLYSAGNICCIIICLLVGLFIRKIKNMKVISNVVGIIAVVLAMCIMVIPPSMMGVWQVCYFGMSLTGPLWATFFVGLVVGQWFPTKKGTFMGIATLAFPIVNGSMGIFAGLVFAKGYPDVFGAFLPYWIIVLIGLLLGIFAIKDYPEQCGCYRDNNKDMTAEVAMAMLENEKLNKLTSVWKTGSTLSCRDFWFMVIPLGCLLLTSVGMASHSATIIGSYGAGMDPYGGFAGVMSLFMIFGIIGSVVAGFIDTAVGTKKAIIITCVVCTISGLLGMVGTAGATVIAIVFLSLFTGAASNFLVSLTAQYWRREDFSSVYGTLSPIANIMQAIGPVLIATVLVAKGVTSVFGTLAIIGAICVVLSILFSPKHVKEVDDKRREKAGKPLDDALVGRK